MIKPGRGDPSIKENVMIEIKHKITGAVIYTHQGDTLVGANLSCANLRGADLLGVNLHDADLSGANLRGANLRGADLRGVNLRGVNLSDANLSDANLRGANLRYANIRCAYLYGANLYGAIGAELILAQRRIVPSGTLTVYKKLAGSIIATLEIPADAQRCNALDSRKCRASKAVVRALSAGTSAVDGYTGKLVYVVGQAVTPDSYDPNIYVECSHGIHFFLTRIEAERY